MDISLWYSHKATPRNLSPEQLRTMFRYDEDTGEIIRLVGPFSGQPCRGISHTRGKSYVRFRVANEGLVLWHIVAWTIKTGEWPLFEIDHVNGDGIDNRWSNLRRANRLLNNNNTSKRKDSAELNNIAITRYGKYQVTVKYAKRTFTLGSWDTQEEAVAVRDLGLSMVPHLESHGMLRTQNVK